MAVYAAHLTRTLQGTPSVFQVTAQEALGNTVKPALRRLVQYLASVYPNKCGWCERWYDELYLLLDYTLQYHYLKHYAASFSECFYGLHRVAISPNTEFDSGSRLPETLERGSLALLVLVPYIRDKVEKFVEIWREDSEDGRLGKNKKDEAKKAAVKLYTIIHFVTEASRLIVLARYLTGKHQAPTLPLYMLGLTLSNAPPEEPDENTWTDFYRSILAGQFGSAVVTFPMVYRALSGAAQHGAFAVQMLRWWGARAPLALRALPAPPPPPPQQAQASAPVNACPLCRQPWRAPAALPVSGYVFCYTCISRALRGAARCPVTGLPAADRDLVRLYLDV
ncbi:unnamed protein product, partial [Brenthis ino]